MGVWNSGLYCNDTTADVRDTYKNYLENGMNNEDAYQKTYEEYEELIGTDEEELFWYALADTQWNVGRLMEDVKDKAIGFIEQSKKTGMESIDSESIPSFEKVLQKLEVKLMSPMPCEKRFPKHRPFIHNPWNVGDIYAYQFHSEKSKENDLFGKYIMFQKVGNAVYYEHNTYSVIQIFDKVYSSIPSIDEIMSTRVLPLMYQPREEFDFNPPLERQLKALMVLYKKGHYPKEHMHFVGNTPMPDVEYDGNYFNSYNEFFWDKTGIEDWIITFYLQWRNVEY